jgi:integral membrane protein
MEKELKRFRVLAYVVGVALLLLVTAMVLKYAADAPTMMRIVGPGHGFLYAVYLVVSIDLAIKARWSMKGTGMVLIAGMIPFLSFYAERKVHEKMQAGQPL